MCAADMSIIDLQERCVKKGIQTNERGINENLRLNPSYPQNAKWWDLVSRVEKQTAVSKREKQSLTNCS